MRKKNLNKKNKISVRFNFFKKLDLFSEKIYFYFVIPFLILILLVYLEEKFKHTDLNFLLKIIIGIIFTIWVVMVLVSILRKTTKIGIIWPLVVSFVFFVYAYFIIYNGNSSYGNVFYHIGIFFMEVYILYSIFYNVFCLKNKLSIVILLCVLFVVIGYMAIFSSSYNVGNNTIFNSLITVFSAIIGGGLTLGGVAWTITHEKELRKYDEKLKIKPVIFVKNSSYSVYLSDRFSDQDKVNKKTKRVNGTKNLGTLKKAVKQKKNYIFSPAYIVNSDYSYVAIRGFRINDDYHIYDIGQVINKNEEIILIDEYCFSYNKKISYVSLILQDVQNNFYEMEVNYSISQFQGKKYIEIISSIDTKESNLNLKNY